MKLITVIIILALISTPVFSQFSKSDYTYIQVDDSRTPFFGDKKSGAWCFGYDVGDVNGDSFADIASGKWLHINPGGDMTGEWIRVDLPDTLDAMFILNIDDDKYGDIIALKCKKQYWLEPKNKKASQWNVIQIGELPICNHGNSTQGYLKSDIEKGGKQELIFTTRKGDIYYLVVPEDPVKEKWEHITVCIDQATDKGIGTGDIDGDGDLDIVSGYKISDDPIGVCWFENPGNRNNFWERHPIGQINFKGDRFAVADINGDKKPDVIVVEGRYPGKEPDASLFWFEKSGPEWKRHKVLTQYSINSLSTNDFDADGDIDLVIAEHKGPDLKLQILENNGTGKFTIHIIDKGKENHIGARLFDMDNDGDLDISGFGWTTYQYIHLWRNNIANE